MKGAGSPGDYPVGSLESRAAARLQLARRIDARKHVSIVNSIPRPRADNSRVNFDKWEEWPDDTLGRVIYVPHVWVKPGDATPACPDCGTPFKKTKEYPGMIGYVAQCMDKHDPEPRPNVEEIRF